MSQAVIASARHPTFEDVFGFYAASGFLYAEKLEELHARFHSIRQTWQRLLENDNRVFKILFGHAPDDESGRITNSICAFEYAPGTWQGQHLVSGHRHGYIGTLRMLMTLVDWFQGRPEVEFARLTFRPNNPGTNRLFGRVPSRVPPGRASLTVYDYFVMPLRRQAAASAGSDRTHFNIVRAEHVDADRVDAFYRGCLPDAQRHSLSLCAPDLTGLDAKYREAGLRRYRAIFVAERHGAILGSAICNVASEGINFSFLENALEAVEVDASLAESEARAVFHGLICTAVEFYRELGRDYLVALINPKYAQFRQDLAINGATSKQYAVLTVDQADGSFSLSQAYFLEYYRALLGKGSIGEVAWQ